MNAISSVVGRVSTAAILPLTMASAILTAPAAQAATFTLADVQQHAVESNCWSIVGGNVYNLTAWIPRHEGGKAVIIAMCGMDATAPFLGQHSGQSEPAQKLAQYQIGTLSGPSVPNPTATYTMAQVATHNTAGDCWSAINGGVYGLSGWIGQHPGGGSMIVAMCGNDASGAYNGKHGGSGSAGRYLALLRIGSVVAAKAVVLGSYTAEQVAAHNTPADCWSTVSGNVYDLTKWIGQHPGKPGPVIAMCGIDGTAAFVAQHGTSSTAASALALYKVGTLIGSTATTAAPIATTTTRSFTLRQVRRHHTARNCWTAVNRNVYNLTPWTKRHPHRTGTIKALCGVNATKGYNARHGGPAKASRILKRYQVGVLGSAVAAPTATAAPAPAGLYSMADVVAHATATACWSAVSGSVYDLTGWIVQHPGGQGVIKAMCGIDATASFQGKHAKSAGANAALAKLKIGVLG